MKLFSALALLAVATIALTGCNRNCGWNSCDPCYQSCDPCYQPCQDPCYQPCYQPCNPCPQPCNPCGY